MTTNDRLSRAVSLWPCSALVAIDFAMWFWLIRSPEYLIGESKDITIPIIVMSFGLIAVLRLLQVFLRSGSQGSTTARWRSRAFWLCLIATMGLSVTMAINELPLRLCFRLSRTSFDRVAQAALRDRANLQIYSDTWVGLYRLAGVEVIGGTVILYADKPGGVYGFARIPGAKTDVVFNMTGLEANRFYFNDFPKQIGINDPIGRRIEGDWFLVYPDYKTSKRGWN